MFERLIIFAIIARMTRVFLIRHGATVLSLEDRFAGSSDVALSDDGRMQAERLGRRLATEKIAAVYCSDMHRAINTAAAVAAPHGLTPIPRTALREIDHGHWEGRVHKEVEREFAAEYAAWDADPLLVAPPGGETGLSVLARSLPELRKIVDDHADQTIAVVSHKATNRLLLCSILGIELRLYRARIAQDTACLNVIEFRDAMNGRVTLMNDVSHYKAS
jgi:probable phosphoglycerate mutase